jgi:hypothetical protein
MHDKLEVVIWVIFLRVFNGGKSAHYCTLSRDLNLIAEDPMN